MVLVDLSVQGAQAVIVSKELSVLRRESPGSDMGPMTEIGRKMVRRGAGRVRFGRYGFHQV